MYLPADQGIPLTALMIWSCSVLADITQVFLQCRRKWGHWTPGLGAGSWEDGNVTRLASWPVSASTRTVTYTLANKVLQMVLYPETSWAGRLCYGFETPILQLICSLLHSMFLPCCWQTLQHYWSEISSDHAFPNPSPTLSVLLYCKARTCTKHSTVPSGNIPKWQTHLNQKQSSCVNVASNLAPFDSSCMKWSFMLT